MVWSLALPDSFYPFEGWGGQNDDGASSVLYSLLGPTQSPVQWISGLSRGVKRPRRGVDHPPPSRAEVEGRVELYVCSSFGPSWPVLG